MTEVLEILATGADPELDRTNFVLAQLTFWLLAATDGHAKNFTIRHLPGGTFQMESHANACRCRSARIRTNRTPPRFSGESDLPDVRRRAQTVADIFQLTSPAGGEVAGRRIAQIRCTRFAFPPVERRANAE
jgi:hypothetical protein